MAEFGLALCCVALIALSCVSLILVRRVNAIEKAFRVAAERLEESEYV